MKTNVQGWQRPAAALVEMAAVVVIFLMFLFGIMEYCRFLFVRQLVVNAAREGARYAVVNITDATIVTDATSRVQQYMGGMDKKVRNFTIQVFEADTSGNYKDAAGNAQFGEYVAVQIDCDYDPILPTLLFMGNTIHIQSKALMCSEAN